VSCVDTPPPTLTAFYAVHCEQHNWERGHHHLSYLPLLRARCVAQVYIIQQKGGGSSSTCSSHPASAAQKVYSLPSFSFLLLFIPPSSLYILFFSYITFPECIGFGAFPPAIIYKSNSYAYYTYILKYKYTQKFFFFPFHHRTPVERWNVYYKLILFYFSIVSWPMDVTNSVKGVSFAAFLTRRIQKKGKDFSSSSVWFRCRKDKLPLRRSSS
jgi:hypothetical protein